MGSSSLPLHHWSADSVSACVIYHHLFGIGKGVPSFRELHILNFQAFDTLLEQEISDAGEVLLLATSLCFPVVGLAALDMSSVDSIASEKMMGLGFSMH
jgi:hypothetical protein